MGVAGLKPRHLPNLRSIAVTTNGFLTDTILGSLQEALPRLEARGIGLVLAMGLDAVGERHEQIRNHPGGWRKLDGTIEGLRHLRERHPALVLGAKTTVSRHNVRELSAVADYAGERGMFTIISPYILTAGCYDNVGNRDALALTADDVAVLIDFYKSRYEGWSSYRDELVRFLHTGRMDKACTAGYNYYFVRSTGELMPCPLIDSSLGNVEQTEFRTLIDSVPAQRFRRRVGDFPECAGCTEPGLYRYALPFEGWRYLRLYFQLGRERFLELHAHLGLDKYLG